MNRAGTTLALLLLAALAAEAQSASIWSGAFTAEQAKRGSDAYQASCSACHGIDEYGYYAMDREAWHALIERMKRTPSGLVPGAVIADADKEVLLDWLVANFGPEATPFRRQYVVRPVTDETRLDDGEAMRLLDTACASCHSPLGPILDAGLDEPAWRERLTAKIASGVPLLIDEVDPLIDWLRRTR